VTKNVVHATRKQVEQEKKTFTPSPPPKAPPKPHRLVVQPKGGGAPRIVNVSSSGAKTRQVSSPSDMSPPLTGARSESPVAWPKESPGPSPMPPLRTPRSSRKGSKASLDSDIKGASAGTNAMDSRMGAEAGTLVDQKALMQTAISTLEFDAESIDTSRLLDMVVAMFEELKCTQVSSSILRKFLREVKLQSPPQGYHSFANAMGHVQILYYLLTAGGARGFFDAHDVMAMLIMAATHNMNHPGRGLLYLSHPGKVKEAQGIAKKFYEEHPQCVMRLASKVGCEIFSKYEAYELGLMKAKLQLMCSTLYSSETRLLHDQPDLLLKQFQDFTNSTTFTIGEVTDYTNGWQNKERHRLLVQFFFSAAVHIDCARPLGISSRLFEAILAESGHIAGEPGPSFNLDVIKCDSDAEARSRRHELYQKLKYYLEETMEVPLMALSRIMPNLNKVIEEPDASNPEEVPLSVLGAVVHFRRELFARIKNAKRTEKAPHWNQESGRPLPTAPAPAASESAGTTTPPRQGRRESLLTDIGLRPRDVIGECIVSNHTDLILKSRLPGPGHGKGCGLCPCTPMCMLTEQQKSELGLLPKEA